MNVDIQIITRALGRVIIPFGSRIVEPPKEPNLIAENARSYAGVYWGTMVSGVPITGEVMIPVDTAGNFTSAVQCARKEIELMFEAFFPPGLPDAEDATPQLPAEEPKVVPMPPQVPGKAPVGRPPKRRMGMAPVHQVKPEPATPPPIEAPAPAAEKPRVEPAPTAAGPSGPEGEPEPDFEDEPPAPAQTTSMAPAPKASVAPAPDPGDYVVNLPCKYANKKLREIEKVEAIKWFAENQQTSREPYLGLRQAAAKWYAVIARKAA